jgi:hypothetical protein
VRAGRLAGHHDARLDSIRTWGDRAAVVVSWADRDGIRRRWIHALRLKHGKIVALKDHPSPTSAAVAARLRLI